MHIPVLLQEVLDNLDIKPGKKYLDLTYGEGGHAKAIVERGGKVLGIDRDPEVVARAKPSKMLEVVQGDFSEAEAIASRKGFINVDGILIDLGFGSHQLDDSDRGFSFQNQGPLDMRYNQSESETFTAADIVNKYNADELLEIFQKFGEERKFSKAIVRKIVQHRESEKVETTSDLHQIIKAAIPEKFGYLTDKTTRRIFQSLRIAVNRELENVEKVLPQALDLLNTGGRLAVISFHSLEDRIVKNFFKDKAKTCICPPEIPVCRCDHEPEVKIVTKKPITASEEEVKQNSRAKSAKLRVVEKI